MTNTKGRYISIQICEKDFFSKTLRKFHKTFKYKDDYKQYSGGMDGDKNNGGDG